MTNKTEIHIHGPMSILKGDYPFAAIREGTSYPVEGAQFSKSYRKGLWDGRKHLFNARTGSFPTGLVSLVEKICKDHGLSPVIVDHRPAPNPEGRSLDLVGVKMEGKYDYQLDACMKMIEAKQGIVKISTNGGKCLGLGTPVRMYDGSVKKVEDLVVGDQLMGPDNLPRKVRSSCRGTGPLYEIKPARGMPWVCNDVHVLTLQHTATDEVVDISLDEYLEQNKTFKHCYKQFSVGVEYPNQEIPVDPYFVGLWIGDGTKALKTVAITTMDEEILSAIKNEADKWGCTVYEDDHPNNRSSTYHVFGKKGQGNKLLRTMRELFPSLRIPNTYLINDRSTRLQLLAGILDSDGHCHEGRFYEVTFKEKTLADDIYCLARSLGFGASCKPKVVDQTTYWRVNILGANIGDIPVRLSRKQITCERKKHPTRTKFDVRPLGQGEYAGFTLDGDGRFLLADYTVTHNTECAAAVTKYLGLKTLFIVTNRELLYQARDRFKKRLGLGDDEVGIVGDGHWSPGSFVTIATVDTLESRINTHECQELIKETEVLFIDEAHHVGSETWYTVSVLCPAYYRYGLSGTPLDRTDGANLRLIAATGEVIVNISNKFLVERGISAKAEIIFDQITEPIVPKGARYPTVYKQGVSENPNLHKRVIEWTKVFRQQGLGTLILVEELSQGRILDDLLWTDTDGEFIPHQFIHGEEETEVRQKALQDFASGNLPVLIASTILDEGVDVPTIDALILAGSRKSRIRTMQRLGRGLRGKKLIVVEFANFCHKYLIDHSMKRLDDYKAEDCFGIHQSGPNPDLVRDLWTREQEVITLKNS